jgi:hypothetical protein
MAAIGFIVMSPEHCFFFRRQLAQLAKGCANAHHRLSMGLTYQTNGRLLGTAHAELLMRWD